MATPIIQSNGSLSGLGVAGQGRNDLQTGEVVTLSDVEAANAGASYVWAFEDKPIGSVAVMNNPMTATPDFSPDVEGSYRVRATANGVDSSFDILAVPLPNTGARIPSFDEETGYDGNGNVFGWHQAMDQFMRATDAGIGGAGTDPDAIHDNVAAEISAIANKATPVGADVLIIEDSADAFNKKSILASTLLTDANAIHGNVAGEIFAITEKVSPVAGDWLIIEDSAAGNAKKRAQVGNLPGVGGGNDLEQAYNQGGAGAGRTINAISGAVLLQSNAANNDNVLEVIKTHPGGVHQSGAAIYASQGPLSDGFVIHANVPATGVGGTQPGAILAELTAGATAGAVGVYGDIQNVGGIGVDILLQQATTQGIRIANTVPNTGNGIIDVDVVSGSSTATGVSVTHAGSGWAAFLSNSGTGSTLGVGKSVSGNHGIQITEAAPAPASSLLGIRALNTTVVPMLSMQRNNSGATAAAAQMIYAEDDAANTDDMIRLYHRGDGHAIQITEFNTSPNPAVLINMNPAGSFASKGLRIRAFSNVTDYAMQIEHSGSGKGLDIIKNGTGDTALAISKTGTGGLAIDVTNGISRFRAAGSVLTTLTDAPVIATNAALGNVFQVTLTANRTLGAPTNLQPGFTYVWIIRQNGAGGHTLDVSNAVFLWPGGTHPVIASGANEVSMFSGVYDGTSLHMVPEVNPFS